MALQDTTTRSTTPSIASHDSTMPNYARPLAVVTTLFFMWGLLTSLNDILVPHLKSIFDLSYTRAMLVQFAFFSAYFLFSLPWSKAVNIVGYQRSMVAGLLTMTVGALLFIPAASAASYPLFLTALVFLACGITGLQVAANPYVVALGKPQTASSRLDLTQAFNSLGTTIGPKIGGLLILSSAPLALEQLRQLAPQALQAYRVQTAASVKMPYAVIGAALLLLAVLIGAAKLPNIATTHTEQNSDDTIWKHPNLTLAAIGLFAYVGAEVSIGSFLVNYFGLPEIQGLSAKTAAGFVSFYWGGAMIGRFLGAGILRRVKAGYALAFCAIAAATLVTVSMLVDGYAAMWTVLAVGLFNSIMFPTIFSLGMAELGTLTGSGSGLLNMAIVGGAIVPLLVGALADRVGLHHAFIIPVICYLYILYYGLSGSKPNSERYAKA
jgi:FHS family L-fucose permease-like MFS transporter